MRLFQLTASRRGWLLGSSPRASISPISTHSLTKRLTLNILFPFCFYAISTHSLTKRLTCSGVNCIYFSSISTHSLTKRLTLSADGVTNLIAISTHSLTKRLTVLKLLPIFRTEFQLTASRRGWPIVLMESLNYKDISTHSLTKRLTKILSFIYFSSRISTHSLTKRLTEQPLEQSESQAYFNSQPHEEADALSTWAIISKLHFNSQPHEEADHVGQQQTPGSMTFQLTASRRGWLLPESK